MSEEVELFDASNIEHAKKLAAALWAVDISVEAVDAPPARRVILKVKGDPTAQMIENGSEGLDFDDNGKLVDGAGRELEVDPRFPATEVAMVQLTWIAKFGEHRYGEAILIPTERKADGMKALSVNMVRTMLALVVNGSIGPAPVTHEAIN